MSKESAREADPLISDPDLEHDRIIVEGVESALLTSIQQQASDPNGPYQPEDLAYLTKLVVEQDVPLFEAVRRTDQRAKVCRVWAWNNQQVHQHKQVHHLSVIYSHN